MGLLTIGAFARASRLTPKALRLYDELGLLPPTRVDPVTGYRLYAPEQLDRARLVAWLRRLGMPLDRVRRVCELDGAAAAREVRAFWDRTEAETAARRDLAAFLVDRLTGKDTTMPTTDHPLGIRYAARSDIGLVRETNQDAAYAGSRLLAVADGFGEDGAPASSAAIDVKSLEADGVQAGDLLNALQDAVRHAHRAVNDLADPGTSPGEGTAREGGTTLTALLWTGSRLALVHIGDSRAYLLRDGGFFQITHDHTLVQSLVDEGRLSPEEAKSHPQRALLLRALGGDTEPAAEIRLHGARAGDRYLLCSDGLSAVVPAEEIRHTVSALRDPDRTSGDLVELARRAGAPDNVSCVVADVVAMTVPA